MINSETVYFSLLLILAAMGIYLLSDLLPQRKRLKVRFKKDPWQWVSSTFSDLQNQDQDQIFRNVGIKLSLKKYLAIRNTVLAMLVLLSLSTLSNSGPQEAGKVLLTAVLIYLLSSPHEKFMGKKTPFLLVLELTGTEYLNRKDDELIAVITQMKNLAAVGHSASADSILQNLMRFTSLLKPVFAHTLSLLRRSRVDEAREYFKREVGTKLGADFSAIIPKLDELETGDFRHQLEMLLSSVKERRATRQHARQQNLSNLVFTSASIGVFFIFADFMYIIFTDLIKSFQY